MMPISKSQNPIAYFCNEFAIDNELPTYSGGLGILAGDVMSEAADKNFPYIGIGILYKGRGFDQHITGNRKEEKRDTEFDHDTSFLRQTMKDGKPLTFTLPPEYGKVTIKSYHIRLADSTILYFLSTDVDDNPPEWISDMEALYRGDTDSQIRQQILLGIGGIRLLKTLNIIPRLYHINEGRPGFLIWEIVADIISNEKIEFDEAWKRAKKQIIYTNHTLIPAGNLEYDTVSIEKWTKPFAQKLQVDTKLLIKDGLINSKTFSITKFALNISSKQSAVSKIHSGPTIIGFPLQTVFI
jgi:starch phosphorylase